MRHFINMASLLALACAGAAVVTAPAPAHAQFKSLGKIVSDVEKKTADAEERAAQVERSVDQTKRTADTAERVGQKLGILGKGSTGNPTVEVDAGQGDYADYDDEGAYDAGEGDYLDAGDGDYEADTFKIGRAHV